MDPKPTRTRRRLSTMLASAAAATALLLSGCGLFGESQEPGGDGEGGGGGSITAQVSNFNTLDPHTIQNGIWIMQMGLSEGLVLQTPDGKDVRPALAESWDVSDDGLTYTFHLRDAKYSDGSEITANDFMRTYERLLDPERGGHTGGTMGATSYQLAMGIENAADFSAGVMDDFEQVGIKEIDDKTLEFTLAYPNAGFVFALTHPSMMLLHPDSVESGDWETPDTFVTAGPYTFSEWQQNSSMTLKKNPEYWDADNVALDTINLELVESGSISTTVPFESGEVDIQALTEPADVDRFMADPELSERITLVEKAQTGYLAPIHSQNPIMEDERVRQAISLGIGREEIAGLTELQEPAWTLMSDQLPGWSEDLAFNDPMWGDEAVARAQELLTEAGYPNGEGFPKMYLLAGGEFPYIDIIVERLKENLGIEAEKDIVEAGVYVEKRAELHDEDYVGFWVGSYSGPFTWTSQVQELWNKDQLREGSLDAATYQQMLDINEDESLTPGERTEQRQEILAANADPRAQEFAEIIDQVTQTGDPEEQEKLLMEASAIREETQLYIPTFWNSFAMISQERVEGFSPRAQADRYYFRDLSVNDA